MKNAIARLLRRFNLKLSRNDVIQREMKKAVGYEGFMSKLPMLAEFARVQKLPTEIFEHLLNSKSQLGQDLFVLSELGFKRDGFFVEFGATNGIDLSNTYLLERSFGWHGILAEPARRWHEALRANRSCSIETDCVWRDSVSRLDFREVEEAEFSTIGIFTSKDPNDRTTGTSYGVKTISLADMLEKYNAPRVIDYLSIDTEGSELDILTAFDFNKYHIRVISCEHNFTKDREKLKSLFEANGFERKYEEHSKFDDWYVHR